MAGLQVSETQFAFTWFMHFVDLHKKQNVDFLFPSTYKEGRPEYEYAGADLVVRGNMFIQFKMPELMVYNSAAECQHFPTDPPFTPFFRFEVKNIESEAGGPGSGQFNLLKRAAEKGHDAKYIAPFFDTAHFDHKEAGPKFWFPPFYQAPPRQGLGFSVEINFNQFLSGFEIEATNNHRIVYNTRSVFDNNLGYFFSKPKEFKIEKISPDPESILTNFPLGNQISISENFSVIKRDLQVDQIFEKPLKNVVQGTTPLNSTSALQAFLLSSFNIHWIPVVSSRQALLDTKLDAILK